MNDEPQETGEAVPGNEGNAEGRTGEALEPLMPLPFTGPSTPSTFEPVPAPTATGKPAFYVPGPGPVGEEITEPGLPAGEVPGVVTFEPITREAAPGTTVPLQRQTNRLLAAAIRGLRELRMDMRRLIGGLLERQILRGDPILFCAPVIIGPSSYDVVVFGPIDPPWEIEQVSFHADDTLMWNRFWLMAAGDNSQVASNTVLPSGTPIMSPAYAGDSQLKTDSVQGYPYIRGGGAGDLTLQKVYVEKGTNRYIKLFSRNVATVQVNNDFQMIIRKLA